MKWLWLAGLALWSTSPWAAQTLVACGGDNGWPPSSYYGAVAGTALRPVLGYSPDVLRAALQGSDYQSRFTLLPFRRCLSLAAQGEQVQLVMGATFSPQREQQFLFTRHYLHLQPALFLWPGASPRLPLCGLIGFNYVPFGLGERDVDEGSSSYLLLMRKMQAGRCRGFAEYAEVGRGLQLLGLLGDEGRRLQLQPLTGRAPVPLHFMVSRAYPEAARVRALLDEQLQRLQQQGQLARLLARHQAQF